METLFKKFRSLCRKAFYDSESKLFVIINDFLSFVIILSIVVIILESVPEFSDYHKHFLFIEYAAVLIFSLEYICRIIGSNKKLSYIFSFFGLIDLVSVLPTWLHLTNLTPLKSVRALRVLRFLRIMRLAKVARFEHLKKPSKEDTVAIIRLNIQIYFLAIVFSLIILGTLAYGFEHNNPNFESIPLSMLWVLESLLGGGISTIAPETYGGIAIFMVARFISFVMLGFLIHIIGTAISYLLLGKSTNEAQVLHEHH